MKVLVLLGSTPLPPSPCHRVDDASVTFAFDAMGPVDVPNAFMELPPILRAHPLTLLLMVLLLLLVLLFETLVVVLMLPRREGGSSGG